MNPKKLGVPVERGCDFECYLEMMNSLLSCLWLDDIGRPKTVRLGLRGDRSLGIRLLLPRRAIFHREAAKRAGTRFALVP